MSAVTRVWNARLRHALAGGGLALGLLAPSLAVPHEHGAPTPPIFFDPVVSISPGISRELDLIFDHVRASAGRVTQPSIRLQYPVQSWLQFSLEVPAILLDPDGGTPSTGVGDILLQGQAMVWAPSNWRAEVDVGLEIALPTGGSRVFAGSTAVRPFLAGGVKVGPVDVIGNLSYQWQVAGPVAGVELFQTSLSIGYPSRWVAPFAELTLAKPVRGIDDDRPQVALVPGLEVFLPWSAILSVGVQLPLGPGRAFDQRVLAFFKWPF